MLSSLLGLNSGATKAHWLVLYVLSFLNLFKILHNLRAPEWIISIHVPDIANESCSVWRAFFRSARSKSMPFFLFAY